MPHDDVHPDLRRIWRVLPRTTAGPRTLPLARRLFGLTRLVPAKGVEVVRISPDVTVRVHHPDRDSAGTHDSGPALLWIHSGGYVMGTARQDDLACRRLVRALGVTVVSVDYRLAPEHPYPTPLEDCYCALRWLARRPGVTRVAIGGASAGGGLAAALAILARDRGEVRPVLQVLLYPMLDDRSATAPGLDDSRHRLWDQRSNAFGWASYLAGHDPADVAPARRGDLEGLAPAWIGVGTLDLLHDEAVEHADRLAAAGVPCTLDVVEGAFHGFDQVAPRAPVVRDFFARQCEALRLALLTAG